MPSLRDLMREGMMVRVPCCGCPRVVYHDPKALIGIYRGDRMLEQISVRCLRCNRLSWGATSAEPLRGPDGSRYPMPIAVQDEEPGVYRPAPPSEQTFMTRGAFVLGDYDCSHVEVRCDECKRHGRIKLENMIAKYGSDQAMPDLLAKIAADCPKVVAAQTGDRCQIYYLEPTYDKLRPLKREKETPLPF